MTHNPHPDTPALAASSEPVVSRAALFHHTRMDVYRLSITTTAGGRSIISRPALLTELRDAVRPDQGGTGAGGSSPNARVALDVGAHDLYQAISKEIASAYETATDRPAGDAPEQMLIEWFIELEATGRIRDGLSDQQLLVQRGRVALWRRRIEEYFTPPKAMEILLPCPECDATHAENDLGDRGRALIATHSPGHLTIRCRNCGSTWEDELGATVLSLRTKLAAQATTPASPIEGEGLRVVAASHLFPDESPDESDHEASGTADRGTDTGVARCGTDGKSEDCANGEAEQQGQGCHAASGFAPETHRANDTRTPVENRKDKNQ